MQSRSPEPLLRFACYVAVSYKVYGMDFQYLDANYLFGLVEKVRPDMVKKLKEHGTGRLPLNLQKRKTEHFTASANDAFAVIRITARDNTEECCHEVLNYLCEILEQEDFPRSYAVEFKGPEKSYLPITGLPKKGGKPALCLCRAVPRPPPPDGTVRPACYAAI